MKACHFTLLLDGDMLRFRHREKICLCLVPPTKACVDPQQPW